MKVEFDVPDGMTVLSGVAVLHCADEEGRPHIIPSDVGDIRAVEAIGLLTVALDEAREGMLYDTEDE